MQLRQAFQMSERRACLVVGTDRASVRYRAVRPEDGVLRERLKALAQQRRRFGYRRLYVLLRREGELVNKKRVQRLYREERLSVRRRGRMLAIVDDCTRECLTLVADTSISGRRVARELDNVARSVPITRHARL